MAEEIQKKKISELPSAVYLSDEDVMPVVQGSGSSEVTKKADIGLVGSTLAESKTFSNLDTTSKTLVGAINEVNSSLGNVPSADEISYDNTSSGLSASDVQGAIDEIAQGGSGGSIVTVTQIQTTGTKIATITVDSVGTDLYAPNGGGGASAFEDLTDVDIDSSTLANGQVPVYNSNSEKWENGTISGGSGHTILDNEGTSLTQRDDLQFKGAYSEDDNTNEKTVVNVVREMTKAEFDELTQAEKTGLINVTDITGGNDDRFQPVLFSEEEQEIGVWLDGKPLYQKSFIFTSSLTISDDWAATPFSISNIEKIIDGIIWRFDSRGSVYIDTNINGNNIRISTRSKNTNFAVGSILTVRYTKSTDTAGSGQWTPQGVPAHHYSEDEQIVGTWIDGGTLYEKTVTNISLSHNSWTTIFNASAINATIREYRGIISLDGSVPYCQLEYYRGSGEFSCTSVNNGELKLLANIQSPETLLWATIRYTKSST